jgi:hypothetical protein
MNDLGSELVGDLGVEEMIKDISSGVDSEVAKKF